MWHYWLVIWPRLPGRAAALGRTAKLLNGGVVPPAVAAPTVRAPGTALGAIPRTATMDVALHDEMLA